jgi:signal transduction histidine kinase
MRARLFAVLAVLFSALVVTLGVPLGLSYAADQARSVYIDRLADLTHFADLLPGKNLQDIDEGAVLAELRRYEDLYGIPVAFVGTDGSVTLTSRPGVPGADPRTRTVIRAALAGQAGTPPGYLLPWDTRPLVVAQPIVLAGDVVGAVVSVSQPLRARQRVLRFWLVVTAVGVAVIGAGMLVAQGIARWVLRPVAVLDGAAHRLAQGELTMRIPAAGGPRELRQLSTSFNVMAGSVQAAVEAQRAFVADASHQLRNPLGALLVRLEGLTLTAPPGQRDAVERAADDGRHLAHTLDRMLELARTEHLQVQAARVDLAELVDQRLASWQVVAQSRSITLRRLGPVRAPAWHDAAAVVGALDAVLDNALKYSPAGSAVTVGLALTPGGAGQPGSVEVQVTDQGPGLDPEELARATGRFWRSRRHSGVSGSGLGLSIATTLLALHGGDLQVRAGPGPAPGLQVLLRVPAGPAAPAGPPG